MIPRRALLLAVLALVPVGVFAQDTAPQPSQGAARRPARGAPYAELPPPHPSILRVRPWHEDYLPPDNRDYGFRNPGGVGRRAEYYPPGDKFQNDSPRHITARIGLGGQPDRAEQLQAQAVGGANYNYLQSHIDRYGRPAWGFGWGFGFGW
jgi:hypothetical protein